MSWQLKFSEQTALLFDMMNVNWMVTDPGGRGMEEDNKELAECFRKVSMGVCCHCFGKLLTYGENVLEPTGNRAGVEDTVTLLNSLLPSLCGCEYVCAMDSLMDGSTG